MTLTAEVFDGTGTAVIWKVRETRTRTVYIEIVGRVVGVHTVAEAIAAFNAERGTR